MLKYKNTACESKFVLKGGANMKQWIDNLKINLKEKLQNSHKEISQIIYGFLIGICIAFAILVVTVLSAPRIAKVYHQTFTITVTDKADLNRSERQHVDDLLAKNKIISIADVYGNTLDYYNSLITILVALLGAFAILSWISLRTRIKENVQEEIEKFFASPQTIAWLSELVKKQIDQNMELSHMDQGKLIDVVEDAVLGRIEKRQQEEVNTREE